MPNYYQTKIWRLQVPDGWQVQDGPGQELVTLFCPEGVGLLKIFTAGEHPSAAVGGDRLSGSPLPASAIESHRGTSFSRTWILSCRGQKVYVRYTCAAANAGLERAQVDEIVQSISESDDHVT
ncbi:MAG: hypothetical protein J0L84_15500 [Verrucomicrobia bacterium]|nr:hypothetical protein [Verrucomicrobiota bacterium]